MMTDIWLACNSGNHYPLPLGGGVDEGVLSIPSINILEILNKDFYNQVTFS